MSVFVVLWQGMDVDRNLSVCMGAADGVSLAAPTPNLRLLTYLIKYMFYYSIS